MGMAAAWEFEQDMKEIEEEKRRRSIRKKISWAIGVIVVLSTCAVVYAFLFL
jgi:hypothetical protein